MTMIRRLFVVGLLSALTAIAALCGAHAQSEGQKKLVIFAAASMKDALDAANKAWVASGKADVIVSYAASSALANQIEKGAPADIFISADRDWMAYLKERNRVIPASIVELLGNKLVLIGKKSETAPTSVPIGKDFNLSARIGDGKLAMGQVESVPAGKYGKAALQNLGLWETVANQIAQTDNVRAALLLVSRGEAAAGIVYATDAAADPEVATIGVFPAGSFPAIVYPVAITADSQNPAAAAYVAFLRSAEARPFFEKQGFFILADGVAAK